MTTHLSQLSRHKDQIGPIRLHNDTLSIVFSRCDPMGLLFVSKFKKVTQRAEVWVEWGGYRRYGVYFVDLQSFRFTFLG